MQHDDQPIQLFVAQKYQTVPVQRLVESWRVEPQLIIDRVIEHFREMGISVVPQRQQKVLLASMITHLKTSPDIMKMVVKTRNDELKRQRNRHAD